MLEDLINQVKSEGIGIFLISHDIHDVFDVADRISVMLMGRLVDTVNKSDVTKDEVLAMIIAGKKPGEVTEPTSTSSTPDRGRGEVVDVDPAGDREKTVTDGVLPRHVRRVKLVVADGHHGPHVWLGDHDDEVVSGDLLRTELLRHRRGRRTPCPRWRSSTR